MLPRVQGTLDRGCFSQSTCESPRAFLLDVVRLLLIGYLLLLCTVVPVYAWCTAVDPNALVTSIYAPYVVICVGREKYCCRR